MRFSRATVDGCEILHQLKTVVNISLFIGFQPSKEVEDFFHPPSIGNIQKHIEKCRNIQKHVETYRKIQKLQKHIETIEFSLIFTNIHLPKVPKTTGPHPVVIQVTSPVQTRTLVAWPITDGRRSPRKKDENHKVQLWPFISYNWL